MIRFVASLIMLAALAVTSEGSGCRTAAGRTYYAQAAVYAPAVSYYTPYAVPTYSVSYGSQTSPETVELLRLIFERDAARDLRDKERDAQLQALLQRAIEGGMLPAPAKTPAKHPGLSFLAKNCAECHDARGGKGKGDITFLNGGNFVDEGDNLARVLDSIDPFGPKAKDGKAHMPPKSKMSSEETLAITSFLNRLPPPASAKKAPDEK